jgi:hypothetical protein
MIARSVRLSLTAFALTIATNSWAAPADPPTAEASDAVREQARSHFKAGVILLQDPDKPRYEEACTEFKRAYDLVKSPTILGNIGLCSMKLERDADAIEAYTRYLAEVTDLSPAERAQAERDLVTLKAGLSHVTIESHPDGAMVRDTRFPSSGESVTNSYGPLTGKVDLGLRRGHHVLKARYPDGAESTWEVDVSETRPETHVFEHPVVAEVVAPPRDAGPVLPPTRPVPRAAYVTGIATGVFGVGTIVTGLLAVNTQSRFQSANNGANEARASDLHSTGQTLNLASDICLGATIVAAAATAYFYFTRPTVPGSEEKRSMGLVVSPGGVAGSF